MKETPKEKRKSERKADFSAIMPIVTVAFYVVTLAFAAFGSVWFLCVRPPRNTEEFLFLWLILFLGGTAVYYLGAKSE